MEDDDYNVIAGGFDTTGQDELQYPDDDENRGIAVVSGNENDENDADGSRREHVLNELEESGLGRRKRRLENIEDVWDEHGNRSHPVDWHMRMSVYGEGLDDRNRTNAAKRRALDELEQKINEAIENDELKLRGKHPDDINEMEDGFGGMNSVSQLCDDELRRRYSRRTEIMDAPPDDGSPWLGISDSGLGQRFYIRTFRDEKRRTETLISALTKQITRSKLGYASFKAIQKEADELRFRKTENATKEREAEMNRMLNTSLNSMDINKEDSTVESSLWVNKYEAKNYAELLSDDTVNRNLLTWMKMWDECVFKRKVDNLMASLNEKDREILQMDSGKIRRPAFKMVLISGPAGLGKTTLAKIAARQAGYASIDVNTSDARTVADLNRVLEGAVKTSRTLDGDQRPACLILDEIDGAPIDTIRHLVRCLQAVGKKAIRRPIIGICNNLYTPALRELRSVAWCIQLGATKQEKLAKRLQYICEEENLRCDASTLRRLCEMCANDMRHSINTMQWVAVAARKKNRTIGMKLVQEVIEKEKSGAASIFEHWSSVLEVSKHLDGRGAVKSVSDRVRQIQRIAADHGGEDRFVNGLHANYLVPLPIGQLRKASMWFLFYDDIQRVIHTLQNWSVQKYSFVFFVSLHLIIATHARVHITYPQMDQNCYQKHKESEETLNCVRFGGHASRGTPKNDLLLDVLPYLVSIVQPPIKPMNDQLYTQRELAMLNTAVSGMCDYGLTYSATLVKDQVNWLFSPSVDVLTMFPISVENRRHTIANATRQLIAHKITLLRVHLLDSDDLSTSKSKVLTNTEKIKDLVEKEKNKDNTKKRLSSGAMKRIRHQQLADVVFEFQEGDSSAVKKKTTMNQLNSLIFGDS